MADHSTRPAGDHLTRPAGDNSTRPAGDAFTQRFLARVPPDVAATFAPAQLAAVRRAFAMRYEMDHSVDLRRSLILPWGRFYLVVLGGRDRRGEPRRSKWPALACACVLSVAVVLLLLAG